MLPLPNLRPPQLLPSPCSFTPADSSTLGAGCWVLHLRPRRLYDMSATLSAISRMRSFNQYAQTLSSPFLLLFVLVSEALQAPASQKSENRLVRG